MALLTDRTLATGVTLQDLIHIVITGDTTDNPAGSSFKATIEQVKDALAPFFSGGTDTFVTGGTYSAGTATFTNNSGGTFDVTGFTNSTGYWEDENGGLKSINQNTGSISGTSTGALLAGGYFNTNNISDGLASTIINGGSNTLSGTNASAIISTINSSIISRPSGVIQYSTIIGGENNDITDTSVNSDRSVVIGGRDNTISNNRDATIIGSSSSTLAGTSTTVGIYSSTQSSGITSIQSSILAGAGNLIDATSSTIIGGQGNTLNGDRSAIIGGQNLTGTTDDTVFVPNLNINILPFDASPVNGLGVNSDGNVVAIDTGGATIDPYEDVGNVNSITWDVSGTSTNYEATLTGVTTLNLTNVRNGDYGTIIINQDGVGGRTITLGTVNGVVVTHRVVNGAGGTIILTSNASATDILTFTYNGSIMYWTVGNDYT